MKHRYAVKTQLMVYEANILTLRFGIENKICGLVENVVLANIWWWLIIFFAHFFSTVSPYFAARWSCIGVVRQGLKGRECMNALWIKKGEKRRLERPLYSAKNSLLLSMMKTYSGLMTIAVRMGRDFTQRLCFLTIHCLLPLISTSRSCISQEKYVLFLKCLQFCKHWLHVSIKVPLTINDAWRHSWTVTVALTWITVAVYM